MWMTIELSDQVIAWARRETFWFIIWGTFVILALSGVILRVERSRPSQKADRKAAARLHDPDRDVAS